MRSLKNKPQVAAPNSSYPYGQMRDDNGTGTFGTPVNEQVYGDFHQFFEQLMRDGGLTQNELPENEYNGFQLNTALGNWINKLAEQLIDNMDGVWTDITLINGWATGLNNPPQYRVTRTGRVEFRGYANAAGASNSKLFNAIPYLIPKGKNGTTSGQWFSIYDFNAAAGFVPGVVDPTGFLLISTFGGTQIYDLAPITYYNKV